MLVLYLVLLVLLPPITQPLPPKERTNPKPHVLAIWDFGMMALCVLGYNPLIYNNYGCWCGVGGGNEPVDEIDECCMLHDKCYDALVNNGTCMATIWQYIAGYDFNCTVNYKAVCAPHLEPCLAGVCACDRDAVNCWAKHPEPAEKKACPVSASTKLPPE